MKGSGKTDQHFKVGILNEDRRMNTGLEQSGSSPAGAREARLLFFLHFFYYEKMDNRDKFYFFNKVLLSSVPVLFTL